MEKRQLFNNGAWKNAQPHVQKKKKKEKKKKKLDHYLILYTKINSLKT